MRYLKYLRYILRHKWFVMIACFKVGLFWQGLTHDNSKFLPEEFFPYANYFYGGKKSCFDCQHLIYNSQCDINFAGFGDGSQASDCKDYGNKTLSNYRKSTTTSDGAFDLAWLSHLRRNRHHWQWWVLPEDDGGIKLIPMPDKYLNEMLSDWHGAGQAQGRKFSDYEWYQTNKNKMQLNEITIKKLNKLLETS